METIKLRLDELKAIVEFAETFEGNDYVSIVRNAESGIGYTISASVDASIKGAKWTLTKEIVGVDQW